MNPKTIAMLAGLGATLVGGATATLVSFDWSGLIMSMLGG